MYKYSIGIDIGGTKCSVLLGDACISADIQSFILDKTTIKTLKSNNADATLQKIFEAVDKIIEKYSIKKDELMGIGVSCGGPLDSEAGIILNPPNLYGWNNIHICEMLRERYGVKAILENDANACAVAEAKFGVAIGYKNIIFLTCGTGMGAGLILDGKLYRGTNNMAGEIGHVRLSEFGPVGYGKMGSFEGFCSGNGIAQLAQIKILEYIQSGRKQALCNDVSKLQSVTAQSVAQAADSGDELAKEIYCIRGEYLGKGISILIDILNPEIIVLGSVYQRSEKLMRDSLHHYMDLESLQESKKVCKIVPAKLGDHIGDYAALSLVFLKE